MLQVEYLELSPKSYQKSTYWNKKGEAKNIFDRAGFWIIHLNFNLI
jgi:hypothetical protein